MTIDHLPPPDPELIMAENRRIDTVLREHEALLRESESLFVLIDDTFKGSDAEQKHVLCEVRHLYQKITKHLGV